MEEFKGTKGEWMVNGNNIQVNPENPMETESICVLFGSGNEKFANAKLIAASPDLLEALQYILNDINPEDACRGKFKSFKSTKAYVGSKRMPTDEAILRCIEAINKALK